MVFGLAKERRRWWRRGRSEVRNLYILRKDGEEIGRIDDLKLGVRVFRNERFRWFDGLFGIPFDFKSLEAVKLAENQVDFTLGIGAPEVKGEIESMIVIEFGKFGDDEVFPELANIRAKI